MIIYEKFCIPRCCLCICGLYHGTVKLQRHRQGNISDIPLVAGEYRDIPLVAMWHEVTWLHHSKMIIEMIYLPTRKRKGQEQRRLEAVMWHVIFCGLSKIYIELPIANVWRNFSASFWAIVWADFNGNTINRKLLQRRFCNYDLPNPSHGSLRRYCW